MSEFHPNKLRPMRPRVTWRRVTAYWPLLAWIGVVIVTFWTFVKGVEFNRVNGVVDVIQEAVAADEDGRIKKILVRTGDKINKDDPLVEMDTSLLDQQITRLEAAIKSDLADKALGYQIDLNRLKAQKRDLERDKASDEGELGVIEQSVDEMKKQMKDPALRAYWATLSAALARIEGNYGRLKAVKPIYNTQLGEVQGEIDNLDREIKRLTTVTNAEEHARANGDLARLQELKILRDRSVLRSNHTGIVDRIEKDDGEFVPRGTPVVRVVAFPEFVRAFMPEDQLHRLKTGDAVWISPVNNRSVNFKTNVIGISPRVNTVPDTASPLPNQVLHGQEVIMEYPKNCRLAPGQRIIVHLEQPGRIELISKLFDWSN